MLSQSINLYKKLQKQYSRRINLDLTRIKKVLKKLKDPHLSIINPINVIGSDGKYSVLTSLKYFLESEKKSVTAFTSPHLFDLRHRFWLKKKYISLPYFKKLVSIIERTKLKLTLFELLTCVYILAAKNKKEINYNLIESGLFFKKDSTNLWNKPKAQIITNINFQHQDWIKPKTINEICKQKVGYISNNSTIYIARQKPATLKIIKKILKKNLSKKIYASSWDVKFLKNKIIYKDKKNLIPINSKYIKSKALIYNLCLGIKVALDLGVKKSNIIRTIPKIKFYGRIQYLKKGKLKRILNKNENLLIDGCHSIASAKNLNEYLKTLKEPIYGIWGMQKNKMPEEFIQVFKNTFLKIITVPIPNEPNTIQAKDISQICKKNKINSSSEENLTAAIKRLTSKSKKNIVIFGSLYLIGHALKIN